MLAPRKVAFEAKRKENENNRFRIFLKNNADEEELDRQFAELHKELFSQYDCNRCRNCCKAYHAELKFDDMIKAADYLKMDHSLFVETYLDRDDEKSVFRTKCKPCDFLQKDGSCLIGDCKPDSCKKYPYTDQPERLHSLFSVLDVIAVCPVAFEIWERLKKLYNFR